MRKMAVAVSLLATFAVGCEGPMVAGVGEVPAGTGGHPVGAGTGGAASSGGVSGGGATTGTGGASVVVADGLPCDVSALVESKCATCHGATPLATLPSLVTYQGLTAASHSAPAMTNAVLAVARMQSAQSPMPPAGSTAATPAEIASMQAWIDAGYPMGSCGAGGAGGAGGSAPEPTAPTCTSNRTWTGGTDGSKDMQPGVACISCHSQSGGEAPTFALAGTVYPTVHEPDQCYGASGAAGVRVVITGADGAVVTLTPGTSGNFSYQGSLAKPYTAKVTDMNGAVRAMSQAQTSGDCNGCHTQSGANAAPGRIVVP